MIDLASRLRQLADRVADLEPADVCGALEALKLRVWSEALARDHQVDNSACLGAPQRRRR